MIEPVWRMPAALVAANVLFGLILTGAAGWRLPDGREPQRLSQQVQAASIEWLFAAPAKPAAAPVGASAAMKAQHSAVTSPTPARPAPASASKPATPPSPAANKAAVSPTTPTTPVAAVNPQAASAPAAATTAAASPATPAATAALRCMEWGSFNADEITSAESLLRTAMNTLPPSAHKLALSRRSSVEPSSWVVYLPSQDGLQTASTNAATLREMGITDFYVLQEQGPLRFALSLGVFRNAESAERHAAALEARGVRGAQIHARVPANTRHWLRVGNLEESQISVLRSKLGAQEASNAFKARSWRSCG